ncbi:MAG: transcription-repair coupling factor [Caldibacillus debilis]|uniref:Transcription-repair-coupling factor n=1 Tax=Caldibacillus debilis TaxID=301148 RepID=A0A3E0K861_9BACI|nr:transcription-repair coupling factor [Caldibacillus debilis]REJ31341.1 MAG: transcription-repair coupling factor [Caldibacillus debilis]
MKGLLDFFANKNEIKTVAAGIAEGLKEQLVTGLSGSSRAAYIASLHKSTGKSILFLTYNLLQAQKMFEDFTQLLSEEEVFLYPANELIIEDLSFASPELKSQRLETLNNLVQGKKGILVIPVSGMRKLLPPKELWQKHLFRWRPGDEVDYESVIKDFVDMGYTRTEMVTTPGEFCIKGGIIDIYPLTESEPVRIELFDNVIDSIRTFSVETQKSSGELEEAVIGPASEYILEKQHLESVIRQLEEKLHKSLKIIKDEQTKAAMAENIRHDIERMQNGQLPDDMYKYLSMAYDRPASLLDYAGRNAIICVDEISRMNEMLESLDKEEAEWITSLIGEGKFVHDLTVAHDVMDLIKNSGSPIVYFSLFLRHIPNVNPQNILNLPARPMQTFHGQMNILKTEMERWKKQNYTVIFLCGDEERAEKTAGVFYDYGLESVDNRSGERILEGKPQIVIGHLQTGFEIAVHKVAVIDEQELFKKRKRKKAGKQKLSNAERIQTYTELKPGDYVVHVNHGIGKYLGIETLIIDGVHRDYLKIKYKGNDKLYVPIDQIHLVQKYVGTEGKEPKIYKLGGSEWKRVKKKVESSVQDIAEDLIKLYAEREATPGFAFSPDTELQKEFEAAFPYKETEDQLRSIMEVKKDMERPKPMDRLLCGDVGYGKTEVALRAAFKAVMDNKQVAFLVPTTILAQQHYETMRERFHDFPVKIGMLSRFRTRKEQQETIKQLKNGTIDIVVGTHRLLSKDVQFHDLGLLIIDEEQRFGVTHKEKIKQLKTNIDVLTLTATPIPRTLHMSLLGVRDLSIIETPPENRFPVQTYVMEYSTHVVKEAIERELAREGQIYYLYNNIEDIDRKAEEISLLVPDARVIYAHGRMSEAELENVMLSFIEGEYDVLVSTTIIETGVDIPNVNTLIVENADRLGLSQLYQLRGRVGRSNRVAYAYFTYRKDKVLTEVAEKRLQAIKEYTELGSGFKIAMRDLAIRGTGNILGPQQHGFIESVGFDLYSQMLKEAIEKRKGIQPKEEKEVEIDLDIDAYIPDAYISDGNQKIEMYKRFRGLKTPEDIRELREEMQDRFGSYPREVENLFMISEIKISAKAAGCESIKKDKDQVVFLFTEEATETMDKERLFQITKPYGRMVGFGMDGKKIKVVFYRNSFSGDGWFEAVHEFAEKLPLTQRSREKSVS